MNQKGAILLFTILILQILLLFMLAGLQTGLLYSKSVQQIQCQEQLLVHLEQAAQRVLQEITNFDQACWTHAWSENQLLQQFTKLTTCNINYADQNFEFILQNMPVLPIPHVLLTISDSDHSHFLQLRFFKQTILSWRYV